MPREPSRNLRQEAERRVEQRFAQQSEALFASHKEQRERDLRAQQQAIERVAQEQARIADNKRQALEQHERKWDQMRDRIAYKPEPAPSPFGWTPPRDLDREHREMRRQWLDQRETIEQAFNERIEKCQTAQDDLRFAFDAANEIQAQRNRADYETLIATQDRTRESAIQREESRHRAIRYAGIPAAQPRCRAGARSVGGRVTTRPLRLWQSWHWPPSANAKAALSRTDCRRAALKAARYNGASFPTTVRRCCADRS